MKKITPLAAGLVLLVGILLLGMRPGVFFRTVILCDGEVPVWYPSNHGCSEIPSVIEHLWPPERWDAPTFCQGMCVTPLEDLAEQERMRDEWRAAHPHAVAH